MKPKPIINNTYKLHKYPGHGGWIYAVISDVKKVKGKYPKIKVKGTIDDFYISDYILMPFRTKGLFLPIRAEIRKHIGKKEGDKVKVVFYLDESKFEIPEEFLMCLKEEPRAHAFYKKLSQSEQRLYVRWIYATKKLETKTNRIVKSMKRLSKGLKLYEKQE